MLAFSLALQQSVHLACKKGWQHWRTQQTSCVCVCVCVCVCPCVCVCVCVCSHLVTQQTQALADGLRHKIAATAYELTRLCTHTHTHTRTHTHKHTHTHTHVQRDQLTPDKHGHIACILCSQCVCVCVCVSLAAGVDRVQGDQGDQCAHVHDSWHV